ncbi:MAG TPA: zinc-ribbon domain-containing protein [Pyrinomonadaceae bacterium]|nr:zinc-ribbon domain-containing protein [Pyrinomonadaceae bacterium]
MIVICQNCTTRLQLDSSKVPARPFSVRCPKCQQIINAQPPGTGSAQKDGLSAVKDLPVSTRNQQETNATPVLRGEAPPERGEAPPAPPSADGDVLRMLAALLRQGAPESGEPNASRRGGRWENRRVLVCVGPLYSGEVIASLKANQYIVYSAESADHAVERMREERVDVVVLDEEFDPPGGGAAGVRAALDSLRMSERRRMIFVLVSKAARTGDAHAAFLENVNLVINAADAAGLPLILERNVRDLNDLYHDFNNALSVAPL